MSDVKNEVTEMGNEELILLGRQAQQAIIQVMKQHANDNPCQILSTNMTNIEMKSGKKNDGWAQINIQAIYDPLLFLDESYTYGGLLNEKTEKDFKRKMESGIKRISGIMKDKGADAKLITAVVLALADEYMDLVKILKTIEK